MARLDDPSCGPALERRIRAKAALRAFYEDAYRSFARALECAPAGGAVVELGSGVGFLPEVVDGALASDVLPYPDLDLRLDAARLPFADGSLRGLFLLDVLHHLSDAPAFLREAARCLAPGGLLFLRDHYPGWIGGPVYRWLHHEPWRPAATAWEFEPGGPLSSANAALAWIVFFRDRERLAREFPELRLRRLRPVAPLLYWLAGGLKRWTLVPGPLVAPVRRLDELLLRLSPRFGSFVDVEVERAAPE